MVNVQYESDLERVFPKCDYLTPRVIKLRNRFAVMITNDATHNTTSIARR
jgi:hypothetical protein